MNKITELTIKSGANDTFIIIINTLETNKYLYYGQRKEKHQGNE